mmetsp:Transcript_11772/g.26657  ORF Transcript_11772/g.26657 Transcript_11772/m.26657 type:complete len:84 (-) Transcript_11772:419-670(-)
MPAEAKRDPSGDHATVSTHPLCPWQVCLGNSTFRSQRRTVVSPEPLANLVESGENAQHKTASVCPVIDEVHLVTGRTLNTAKG